MADQQELSEETIKQCKEAFGNFDQDGSGSIDAKEIKTVLQTLSTNPTDQDVADMIREADADANGTVDFNEFLKMMTKHKSEHVDEHAELKAAFAAFDKDDSGYIDSKELKKALCEMGVDKMKPADVDDMMKSADIDGDGKINIEEFITVMQGC